MGMKGTRDLVSIDMPPSEFVRGGQIQAGQRVAEKSLQNYSLSEAVRRDRQEDWN